MEDEVNIVRKRMVTKRMIGESDWLRFLFKILLAVIIRKTFGFVLVIITNMTNYYLLFYLYIMFICKLDF